MTPALASLKHALLLVCAVCTSRQNFGFDITLEQVVKILTGYESSMTITLSQPVSFCNLPSRIIAATHIPDLPLTNQMVKC